MADGKNVETLKFTFEGKTFECVPAMVKNYKVQKAMANGESNPVGMYKAIELVFNGKDEEYADMLGGTIDKLSELYIAAVEAVGAKN